MGHSHPKVAAHHFARLPVIRYIGPTRSAARRWGTGVSWASYRVISCFQALSHDPLALSKEASRFGHDPEAELLA